MRRLVKDAPQRGYAYSSSASVPGTSGLHPRGRVAVYGAIAPQADHPANDLSRTVPRGVSCGSWRLCGHAPPENECLAGEFPVNVLPVVTVATWWSGWKASRPPAMLTLEDRSSETDPSAP